MIHQLDIFSRHIYFYLVCKYKFPAGIGLQFDYYCTVRLLKGVPLFVPTSGYVSE